MIEENQTYPIDKSMGGKNAYAFWCEIHEQRRNYGVCLWLKDAYDAGRLDPEDPLRNDCAIAIKRGTCKALEMREEELTAGHALYYMPKREVNPESIYKPGGDHNDINYQRGWNKVGGNREKDFDLPDAPGPKVIKGVAKKPEDDYGVQQMDMSAVVNAVAEKDKQQKPGRTITPSEMKVLEKKIEAIAKKNPEKARVMLERARQLTINA